MRALDRKLLRELWRARGQVIAIALVTTGGIGTVVMATTNHTALERTRALYYQDHRFADVFVSLARAPLDLVPAIQAIPGVREVLPRAVAFATIDVPGYDEPVTGQFVSLPRAVDPDLNRIFLRRGDLARADDEVVVGEPFADAHGLAPGDTLNALLEGRRQTLRISGIGLSPEFVYPIRPGDSFPDYERFGILWMAREPLASAFDLDGAFDDLAIALERDAREADVIDELDRLLAPYGSLGAHGRDLQLSHRFLGEELEQLRVMARMFTAVFLSVTAFLLHVVLGRLVAAQREEIGVLRAFGYTRSAVALHYAWLSLAMVAVGLPTGLAFGAVLGRAMAGLYASFYSFPYLAWRLDPSAIAVGVGFTLGSTLIGTLGGLITVMRLEPAVAMGPESPAAFRRGWVERIGLARFLGPAARMVVRNLERRPFRSTLSILGIGLACGVLVMNRFQGAAIRKLLDVEFALARRDDLEVTFVDASSARIEHDLAALPGVREVEMVRNAPVRLRHGHREYRTVLRGLPVGGDLVRALDTDRRPTELPDEGVLLTDYLALMLDVRPGERIDVDFLSGARRTVEVPVAGLSGELTGALAHARRDLVNRWMQEGDVSSGALLALADAGDHAAVVRSLRAAPRVAGVTDRGAMFESFEETMTRTIMTFTLIATLLGGAICVGVVYNAARITLAERGRELATLRVLGFTRREVRSILTGELFTLAFAALPVGFATGYGLAYLLSRSFTSDLYRIPFTMMPRGLAIAALVVLAATALSVWLVRRRLDRLDLIAVLKAKE